MTNPCLTPGTTWQFETSTVPFGSNRERGHFRAVMTLFPPDGHGGKPYNYPKWYKHGWHDRLTPEQIDRARDAVHAALEPLVAEWQGNPDASDTASLEDEIAETLDDSLDMDWTGKVGARHVVELLRRKGLIA